MGEILFGRRRLFEDDYEEDDPGDDEAPENPYHGWFSGDRTLRRMVWRRDLEPANEPVIRLISTDVYPEIKRDEPVMPPTRPTMVGLAAQAF